jgi:hypothetical protein
MSLQHARAAQYYANQATRIDTYSSHMNAQRKRNPNDVFGQFGSLQEQYALLVNAIKGGNTELRDAISAATRFRTMWLEYGGTAAECQGHYRFLEAAIQKAQIQIENALAAADLTADLTDALLRDLVSDAGGIPLPKLS